MSPSSFLPLSPRCRLLASLSLAAATFLAGPPARADDGAPTVEKCRAELGTLAVSEPETYTMAGLGRYGLGSPSALLRMIAQESGCFAVVERGQAFKNLQQERALAGSGQLMGDSNIGGGQMQAADFVISVAVQFSDDTGGVGSSVSGLLGRAGGFLGRLGGVAGGVKFKEAQTTLLVSDVRSSIQVASAEGNASKMNFSVGGWGWGNLGWASASGYNKTPEGKLIAASLLDNYNKIVVAVRDKPSLIRTSAQASKNNASRSTPSAGSEAPAAPTQAAPMATGTAVPAVRAALLPVAMVGSFSGHYAGGDQGVFSVTVDADGDISGVGQSASGETFTVTGSAAASGAMVMNSSGRAGGAQFNGVINPKSGAVIGTWRIAGGAKGTFNGSRQ